MRSAHTLPRLEGPLAIEGEHHTDAYLAALVIAKNWRMVSFDLDHHGPSNHPPEFRTPCTEPLRVFLRDLASPSTSLFPPQAPTPSL